MAKQKKSERPDILFPRKWKQTLLAVQRREGYEGLGKFLMSVYKVLDGEPEEPNMSPYLLATFDVLMADVFEDQQKYKDICAKNADNRRGKRTVTTVNDREQSLPTVPNPRPITITNTNTSTNTSNKNNNNHNFFSYEKKGEEFEDPILGWFNNGEEE